MIKVAKSNKKEKRIFLTTLSETKNRLDVSYYMCETSTGSYTYTTGISKAEAGIKYILSNYDVDEIIMIGDGEENVLEVSTTLSDVNISGVSDYDNMSEYNFLNYRIAEFMNQVDFELLDIAAPVSQERRNEIYVLFEAFKKEFTQNIGYRELFLKLATDKAFEESFNMKVLSGLTIEEKRLANYYIYTKMDSFYKMHMLVENNDTTMRFIRIPQAGTMSMETIESIVRQTLDDEQSDIKIFMDIQGLGTIDGNTLISTFLLTNHKTGYHCSVKGLINSHKAPGQMFGVVSNVIKSYEIQNLITGLDLFLNYGKSDKLKSYWYSLDIQDPEADRLFYGMDCVDEGISLCNVDLIACGINVIKKTIQNPIHDSENRNIYMQIIVNALISDYGKLLKGESLSIPELLKWSLRKDFLQQTLTIIESKVPEDMVKRGIYYYARNDEDISAFMKELNNLYWLETSKMRWIYSDIEHCFIKFYGRSGLDYRQKLDAISRDYARLRIDAIYGKADGVLKAYSELGNDDLLYELFLEYYRLGNLRNQINHAIVEEPNMDSDELVQRKDNRDELRRELKIFIGLYNSACKKTPPNSYPVLLPAGKMKAYFRNHMLCPLEDNTDLTAKNTYSCSFNGKEVVINISLFKTEDEPELDDDAAPGNEN